MAEDTARAVGAGTLEPVTIAGKACKVRPLSIKELLEVERECLRRFRDRYMESFSESMKYLPEGDRIRALREKIDEVAQWDTDDLPRKYVYDPKKIKITDKLREWLKTSPLFDNPEEISNLTDKMFRNVIAAALDQGMLEDAEYKALSGYDAPKVKTGYANWWTSGTLEGMITMCWVCFKANGVTYDEVEADFLKNKAMLVHLSREIEHLTAPAAGNG